MTRTLRPCYAKSCGSLYVSPVAVNLGIAYALLAICAIPANENAAICAATALISF